jgi:ERF superfamily
MSTENEPKPPVEIVERQSEMSWLERIVEKGVIDPDAIAKLIELKNRQEDRLARAAYQAAMNACQAEMPTVVRDARNGRTGKNYAPLETVQFAAKPVYTRHGFSLSFGEQEAATPDLVKQYVEVMHRAGHVERHYGFFPVDGKGAKGGEVMNAIQGHGSTISYGKRYLLCQVFNINIADEDRDGESNERLTAEEITSINTAIDDCHEAGKPVDMEAFLQFLGVKELVDLPRSKVRAALDALRLKLKQAHKTKGAAK